MGCLRRWAMLAFCATVLTACGGDNNGKSGSNNGVGECQTNADCNGGVCDLSTNTCQGGDTNNGTETNNGTDTNNQTTNTNNDTTTTTNNTTTSTNNDTTSTNNDTANTNNDTTNTNNNTNTTPMCGDGVLDTGEVCDYGIQSGAGACPINDTDCPAVDACMSVTVVGDAGACTAECQVDPITACVNADGCCPGACDTTNDSDCAPKVGQACAQDLDCPATGASEGFCLTETDWRWPGGFCSGACSTNADCADEAHCTGRVCVPDCTSDADCRTGYVCTDYFGTGSNTCAPAPTTAEPPGGACTTDADCLGALFGAQCVTDPGYPGGYCLSACAVDADCPAASHCATTADGAQLCIPDCTTNADCRAGYECFDWLGSGTNSCGPVANGAAGVGEACTVLQDCAGGQNGACIASPDWAGGYCTVTSCSTNSPCPSGSHCGFIDGATQEGICVDGCASAADCRTNYSCVDLDGDATTECAPTGSGAGAVGAACVGVFECAGGADAFCVHEDNGFRAGYCSLNCAVDTDCGAGAHCGAINNGQGLCVADCVDSTTCRADGYACYDWDGDTALECAPAGTGAGATGDQCTAVWDCGGGSGAFCVTEATGWAGGYCTDDGCATDADCVAGGHCGFVDPNTGLGICLDGCSLEGDCRTPEYGCYDLDFDSTSECLPIGSGAVGDSCGGFWDCAGREFAGCAGEANGFLGGYCFQSCGTGSGNVCPTGSTCVQSAGACLDACTSSTDCRAGYTCQPDGQGGSVCLP